MFELFGNIDFKPFLISFKLAFVTTFILFFIALPISWYLSQTKSKIKPVIEAITTLPLVVPSTVLGFYFLIFFSNDSLLGSFIKNTFDIDLVFNFYGLVLASCIYCLPFMVQPLQSGFENLNKSMIEASYVNGKGEFPTLFRIALPNIKPSIISSLMLTFAHTVGEFGIILMIGGSIPEKTKVASIAIYEFVEIMDYRNAHFYSFTMLSMSFVVLFFVYWVNYKAKNGFKLK